MEERNLLASGYTAEVYELEGGRVCKLFFPGYDRSAVEREFRNANLAWSLGVPSPRPYAVTRMDGRDGIIYDRVKGETLAERFLRTHDLRCLRDFADFHKRILCLETEAAVSYKDFLRSFAGGSAEILEKIDRLPEGNRFLHGDCHPGNVLVDERGALILIDFMNVCRGPAGYDVARTCFLIGPAYQGPYLESMGWSEGEIAPYLEVIGLVRERELGGNGGR